MHELVREAVAVPVISQYRDVLRVPSVGLVRRVPGSHLLFAIMPIGCCLDVQILCSVRNRDRLVRGVRAALAVGMGIVSRKGARFPATWHNPIVCEGDGRCKGKAAGE